MLHQSQITCVLERDRVAGALLLGGLVGALLVSVGWCLFSVADALFSEGPAALDQTVFVVFVFPIALVGWAVGLVLIGAPAWLVLHRIGWRSRRAAPLAGGVLTAIPVGLLLLDQAAGPWPWAILLGMSLIGGCVGFVIHRVAYRSAVPPRTTFA